VPFSRSPVLFLVLFGVAVTATAPARSGSAPPPEVRASFFWMPVSFVENRGQMDRRAGYYVQGSDKSLYFTERGVAFTLTEPVRRTRTQLLLPDRPFPHRPAQKPGRQWNLQLDFVGARPVKPRGEERLPGIISYFRGKPSDWKTGIPPPSDASPTASCGRGSTSPTAAASSG